MSSAMRRRRYDSMLFNYESTGRTDFRDGRIRPVVKTEYIPKPSCLRIRPAPLKDIHALTDWYKPIVPFNLLHKPKDIVQTNPRMVQKAYDEPADEFRDEVQKTRPRLVMTPGVSLDDVEPKTRKMLVDDVYTTSFMKMQKESGVDPGRSVKAPLPPLPAPADPLVLEKLKPPYVSPEWRMDSAAWDNRQLRAYCVPTRYFWLDRTPHCDVCTETAEREARRKMQRQTKHR